MFKKSDITFYGICLLAGLLNPCSGATLSHLLYDFFAIAIAITACVLVKNKYERKQS